MKDQVNKKIIEYYSTDPKDKHFVSYLPLILNKANRFIRDHTYLAPHHGSIRRDVVEFSYLYYRELVNRFEDITEAKKYYTATVKFKLKDYLDVEYLKVRYSGEDRCIETIRCCSSLEEAISMYPDKFIAPCPSKEIDNRDRRKELRKLLVRIKKYSGAYYDSREYRAITREHFCILIDHIFINMRALKRFDKGICKVKKKHMESIGIYNPRIYRYWTEFMREVNNKFKQEYIDIVT